VATYTPSTGLATALKTAYSIGIPSWFSAKLTSAACDWVT